MKHSESEVTITDLAAVVASLRAANGLMDLVAPLIPRFMPGVAKEDFAMAQAKFERILGKERDAIERQMAQERMKKQAAPAAPPAAVPVVPPAHDHGDSKIVNGAKKGRARPASKAV